MNMRNYREDHNFIQACEKTSTKPTKRQYSKWLRKMGRAFILAIKKTGTNIPEHKENGYLKV